MAKTSSCGNSSWVVDADTFTVNSSPIAPTGLTADSYSKCTTDSVIFSWNTTAGETYNLEVKIII